MSLPLGLEIIACREVYLTVGDVSAVLIVGCSASFFFLNGSTCLIHIIKIKV